MIIGILSFGGESPMLAPDKLPENGAQATLDCRFSSGDLESARGLGDMNKQASSGATAPAGAYFTDDGNYFWYPADRTVVKSPVIDDFHQRLYHVLGGDRYLRLAQQMDTGAFIAGWDSATTYGANAEVLYPMTLPANYSAGTTYVQGDLVQYPASSRLLYMARKSNNLAHQPDTNPAWWRAVGSGLRYISLQAGNINKIPSTNPTWWRLTGTSIAAFIARAGVPAPAKWAAQRVGASWSNATTYALNDYVAYSGVVYRSLQAGNLNHQPDTSPTWWVYALYYVNVVGGDLKGVLSPYNVPQAVAAARALIDGSALAVPNTSALIAVARSLLQANLTIRARDGEAVNTAMGYYASGSVKVDEQVVQLYPITPGRLYSFDPPVKENTIAEYTVMQLWTDPGNAALASTTGYFNGTRTVVVRLIGESTVEVESASDAGAWAAIPLTLPIQIEGILGVTLTNQVIVSVPELFRIQGNVQVNPLGLVMRGYDGSGGALQFEVDSQNSDLSSSNDNLQYRGLRLVLRDLRLGPWKGAWAAGTYASADRVSYTRSAVVYGFVSLRDGNTETPLPPDWSNATAYIIGDKVFYLGSTYIALLAGTNQTPSSSPLYWSVYYSEWWTLRQFTAELSYGSSKQSYVFTYTLVNDFGEEGPPADPVSIDADYGAQITLHGYINSSDTVYQDYYKGQAGYKIRYYGFVADSQGTGEYRLIHESDELGSSSFAGAFGHLLVNRPADWEEALTSTDFDLPPDYPLAVQPGPNGMLGILTKDYFSVCEPFRGHAWPAKYRLALPFKGIGMLAVAGGWLVTTVNKPYFFAGPIPEQISKTDLPLEQAGISQRSMCSLGANGTAYASNDGIVLVQGLGMQLATGTLFTRAEWRARYGPALSKMRLAYHDGRLICLFPGTNEGESTNIQGFIIRFDERGGPQYSRMSVTGSGVAIDTLDDEMLIGSLLSGKWGFRTFEGGVALPLTWQSKEFIVPRPVNMAGGLIEYTHGPIALDLHVNGTTVATVVAPYSASRTEMKFRLPPGYKAQRFGAYVTEYAATAWSSLTAYVGGETARFGGTNYLALGASTNVQPDTDPSKWGALSGETVHRIIFATSMAELNAA